jgi:hypothetical protein
MHGIHGKEECPNRNPVFFCDFSEQKKDFQGMHRIHGKEECPNRNPVFFCDFSEQTKRLLPNARNATKRGMSK